MLEPTLSTGRARRPTMLRVLAENVIVALACLIAAWGSRWLVVPSLGFTPIVLTTGVAMSAMLLLGPRIVPGIVVATTAGTFLRGGFDGAALLAAPDVGARIALPIGFVAEALLGRFLARGFSRDSRRIESVPTGLHLMLLVGPCATSLGALSTVAPEVFAGRGTGEEMVCLMLVAWVSRTIAAWIFLLPTWAWISNPRGSPSNSVRSVALPVASAFAVVTAAFVLVRATEHERLRHDFDELARASTGDLRNDTTQALDGMQSLVAFLLASEEVENDEFQLFVKRVFGNSPGLDAVSWLPRVSREGRAAFERTAARTPGNSAVINNLDAKGRWSPVPDRDEYFPETFVAPANPADEELYVDTAGCPNMAAAMQASRRTRHAVASEPLDQGGGEAPGLVVLVFVPVFAPVPDAGTAADGLRGYVMAAFYAQQLIEASFTAAKREYLDVTLEDRTDRPHRVYSSAIDSEISSRDVAREHGLEFSSYGDFAGRRWLITLRPTPAYLAVRASWASWLAGVIGFASCVVLGLYELMLSGRRGRIEELVTARTHDLSVTIDRLVTANEVAKVASRAKSEFLANMSHELRTPLLSVLGFTEMMTRNQGTEAERKTWTETVHRNGRQLLATLNDVMDVARMEAGQITIERAPCSVARILNDCVRSYQPAAQRKGLSLAAAITSPIPAVIESDATRLHQVLSQLIGNAVKFTERGSIRVLASSIADDRIEIRVIDTGPGVPQDQLERMFEPFTQADGSLTRKFGGTGLGCTIARRLAELMGGSLRAESEVGLGSTLILELDVGEAARSGTVDSLEAEAPRPTTPADEPMDARILVAEDSDDTQLLLTTVLGRAGADLVLAHDGRAALSAFDAAIADGGGFDLVLLDVQMPVLDGYQTARALRQRGYAGPILALTAHALVADRERCLEAGCDDYVTKPFEAHVLLTKCMRQLERRPRARHRSTEPTPEADRSASAT